MPQILSGEWHSAYNYQTGNDLVGPVMHVLSLMPGITTDLIGISQLDPTGSELTLALNYDHDPQTLTGFWHERTSPTGHYKGLVFHGALQLILDESMNQARGIWVGHNTDATRIKSGEWALKRV